MASRRMNRTKSFGSYLNAINSQVADVSARNEITSISAGAITGDSLAENVTLFGSAIQSKDYIAGSTGWKIDGTGVAEFADVYVRGDINAETGTIGYWNISSPGVTRTIGDRVLFGTFLESNDFGEKDDEITSGVYVGLFKSYFEDASPVTSRLRASNLATVKILSNTYKPGDQVYVTVNEDSSFNNGGLPVTVISSTSESITYYNVGSDFPTYDANGIPVTTVSTGEAYLYNPDVAGLYIQDYGKNSLDYGYFSNQGVAYASASRVNLVHNPSFELDSLVSIASISGNGTTVSYSGANSYTAGQTVTITDSDVLAYNLTDTILSANSTVFTISSSVTGTGNTVANAVSRAYSNTAWRFGNTTSNSIISTQRYVDLPKQYLTSSAFAASSSWSATAPSAARYFRGTIDYAKGVDYHVFDMDKILYLKYDAHISTTSYSALYSSLSTTLSNCTITTTTNHGFSVGDLVVLDFSLVDNAGNEFVGASDPALDISTFDQTIAVVQIIARGNTTFTYANPSGAIASGAITATPNTSRDASSRPLGIYKVAYPAMDLSQITFEYSNGTATPIANVLSDMTTAAWTTNAYKYLSLNPLTYFLQYIDPTTGIPALQEISDTPVMIDSDKLRLDYSTKDAAGYAAKNNITINLPWVLYAQGANAAGQVYTSTTAFQMSSVIPVTAINGNGTTVTYTTVGHNLATGDRVTITGATTTAYNLSNVAITVPNTTHFTVTSGATGTTSAATATAYKTVTTLIDAVSLSTEPIPFFGNTSSDYSWEDPTLNSSAQISLQDTKKWIDINLDDQTGAISNLDYLGFKQSRLNIPMLSQPSIATSSDYNSYIGTYHEPLYDYENLKISGGVASTINLDGTGYNNLESVINLSSSRTKSVAQILATYDGPIAPATASITLEADSQGDTNIEIYADSVMLGSSYGYVTIPDNAILQVPTIEYLVGGLSLPVTISSGLDVLGTLSVTGNTSVNSSSAVFATADTSETGVWFDTRNFVATARDGIPLYVKRVGTDGVLVSLLRDGTQQGSISVSGTTVSYNSFLGSHYTETSDTNMLPGTVMETLDDLVENKYHLQERLPKAKISDVAASNKVYGVYFCEDDDEESPTNGHLIAALGASKIRIAAGLSVSRGDLLESNGDGCARVQSDNVIRSSTIGKVTSATTVATYEDGSYLVPCVLYCG